MVENFDFEQAKANIRAELARLFKEAGAINQEMQTLTRKAKEQDWEWERYVEACAPYRDDLAQKNQRTSWLMSQLERLENGLLPLEG